MSHIDVEVRTYLRYALCDCGARFDLDAEAPMLLSDPPQFRHVCRACGTACYLREKSPSLMTREICE
ncbi:hypothetical protein [Pseudomonas sp. NBRC 111134]|uniref:hypothetical protein n=1 Tax=Pseudomonas sp. NBRC 111134 TaxID=1661049 RepID=UPI000761B9C0|nr:hypothetical protein [Pseudomonas sp. NBRC 111134]